MWPPKLRFPVVVEAVRFPFAAEAGRLPLVVEASRLPVVAELGIPAARAPLEVYPAGMLLRDVDGRERSDETWTSDRRAGVVGVNMRGVAKLVLAGVPSAGVAWLLCRL